MSHERHGDHLAWQRPLTDRPTDSHRRLNVLTQFGKPKEARNGRVPKIVSHSCEWLPLVLGVGARRLCCCARFRVARRTRTRAGRRDRMADGFAACDPPFRVRTPHGWRRPSSVRRLAATCRSGHDLLADRKGEWMRTALEPVAVAVCRARVVRRRHRWPRSPVLRRLSCAGVRD